MENPERLFVLLGYYMARRAANYPDQVALIEKVAKARTNCLESNKADLLTVFSVMHAELAEPSGRNDDSIGFLKRHLPREHELYDKIVWATSGTISPFVAHGISQGTLLIRNHDFQAVCKAVGDEYEALSSVVVAQSKKMPLYKLLRIAGVKTNG